LRHLAGEVVLAARELALELVPPRPEHVAPGFDGVLPAADMAQPHLRRPPVSAGLLVDPVHLGFLPALLAGAAVLDDGAQQLVPVPEDVGFDPDEVALNPFCWVPAAVDSRCWILDDDPGGGALQSA